MAHSDRSIDVAGEAVAALAAIVGPQHVLTGEDVAQRWDGYPPTRPLTALCIVRPANTAEVSAVMAYCDSHGLKVVPHGGRTGLVGAGRAQDDEVVLSLERMRAIGEIDRDGATVAVEAGAILESVQTTASAAGLYYAVDFGARGSATIGGTIATNAGGNSVIRYGMTREQVLGLEAVLADGTVLSSMNRLIKNNSGYDLKQLFVGSEGTLGIVTRAVLRLRPDPGQRATAFVGLADFDKVLAFLSHALAAADGALSSFEVMWPSFLDIIIGHNGKHIRPLADRHDFYVLIEIVSHQSEALLEAVMTSAWEAEMVADAAIAHSVAQADAFWALRDDIEALMTALRPNFTYDVSLPQRDMAGYVAGLERSLVERWPAARIAVFGHIADGNLHLCISTDDAGDHHAVDDIVYTPLKPLSGSISAEHGIGIEKRAYLDICRTPEEIALMRRMKHAFDPNDTLNPGKIFES